jgi:hypothetical protein
MDHAGRTLSKGIGLLLICALLAPSAAFARKPLTPDQVHARILKRGIGNWVIVVEQNGTAFAGRIITIDPASFSLQLHNDPHTTPVLYSDVAELHTGIGRGAVIAVAAIGTAGVIIGAVVAHHEFENHPTLPTQPTQPVFPY